MRVPGPAALFRIPLPRLGADETPNVFPRPGPPPAAPAEGVGSHTGPLILLLAPLLVKGLYVDWHLENTLAWFKEFVTVQGC